jgi:hypothetical protein
MCDRILTLTDAGCLADVIRATEGNRRVARLVEGNVITGTARSIGDDRGNFDFKSDARDQFLRVTTDGGWEMFWRISDLMPEVRSGEFVVGYQG